MKRKTFLKALEGLLRKRFPPEYTVLCKEDKGGTLLEVWYQEKSGPLQEAFFPVPVMTAQILLKGEPALRLFSFLGAVSQNPGIRAAIKEVLLAWAKEPHTLTKLTLVEEGGMMVLFLDGGLPLGALREEGLDSLLDAFFEDWKRMGTLIRQNIGPKEEGLFSA